MDDNLIPDPVELIRELLTPETIADSVVESVEQLTDTLQLDAEACLRIGLTLGMAIPEAIDKTIKAIEEAEK